MLVNSVTRDTPIPPDLQALIKMDIASRTNHSGLHSIFLAKYAPQAEASRQQMARPSPVEKAPPSIGVDLTAGTSAGIAQLIVGHPFDTVKVKLQNMSRPAPGEAPAYTSAIDCARKTVVNEGPAGLYRGITAPMAFVAVFNAVLFAANSTMRKLIGKGRHVDELSMAELGACGVGAGFAVSWVACPTELVKCRLQAQGKVLAVAGSDVYKGPVDCAQKVYATRGVQGLYKGLGATLAREMPANALYFGTYEGLKRMMVSEGQSTETLGAGSLVVAGGFAGIAFWGGVYPVDYIKTKLQTDNDMNPKYRGIMDCVRKTVRSEGIAGLYKGVGPCLARAFPANGITFLVFEWVKSFLTTAVE